MDKKIIDFRLTDVINVIAVLFIIHMTLVIVTDYFFEYDLLNIPCEEQKNRTVANLSVKCFEYYKIN